MNGVALSNARQMTGQSKMPRAQHPACFALVAVILGHNPAMAYASAPCVQFDAPSMVGCRDVSTQKFTDTNPDERLIDVRFKISSLIRHGSEDELIEYLYRITSPERAIRVVDYSPKTTLDTRVVGNLGVESRQEQSNAVGLSAIGQYDHFVKANASVSNGSKKDSTLRYQLLPRLELLAAAGTISRGTGVYFKLKPSDRTSLEGAQGFEIVLRVPKRWRGDYLHVTCSARTQQRLRASRACGSAGFVVAIYDERDHDSKLAAERLARAEEQLIQVAAKYRAQIERSTHTHSNLVREIGETLSLVSPKIPRTWFNRIHEQPALAKSNRFEQHLPADVRSAVDQYRTAKLMLHRFCGAPDDDQRDT